MNAGRVALVLTCVVVAGLGVWFAVAGWEDSNRVASVASALGAIAAVGVALWAALRSTSQGGSGMVRVSRTGRARAGHGGAANTGFTGSPASSLGFARVDRTGEAVTADDGDANTGIRLD